LELLPAAHQAKISDRYVTLEPEDPQILDELAKPQFWTALSYWVSGVVIDRLTTYEVQSLREPEITVEPEEDA